MIKIITILVMVCVSLSTLSVHAAQSTFDTDAEGWGMMFLSTFGNPPTGMAGSWLWWESTIGNPGGCIWLREKAGTNETFKAPEKYLGDKSSAFGTNLTFDLWTYRGTSTEEMFIALVGSDTTLYYKSSVIGGSWNQYVIPLLGSGWKKNYPSGPDAADADMLDVLGNVLALYIWGDFTFFADEYSCLDNVFMYEAPVEIWVDIDIKPGSFPNSINPDGKGVIPVAILSTDNFDAAKVDPDSVRFGPDEAAPLRWALEDVDGDVDIDMIFHFKTQETGISEGDTEATITGETIDGVPITGTDSVRTVPKGKK